MGGAVGRARKTTLTVATLVVTLAAVGPSRTLWYGTPVGIVVVSDL